MENGSLEITRAPFADIFIGPGGVLVGMTDVAGIGRFIGHRDRGCWGPHRMIAAPHAGKFGFGHMARNTPAGFIVGRMVGVSRRIRNMFRMTGHTGVVRSLFVKPVAPAGCMAMQTVELAGFDTWAGQPQGVCVIFSQVTSIRVEIRIFKCSKSKMIEISVSGLECRG